VMCWEDLINLVESMNPYKNTLVLSGWVNRLDEKGATHVERLIFNVADVKILLNLQKKKTKR